MPARKPEQPELDAWALHLFDLGLTQKVIASLLEVTVRTVRNWIKRARQTEAPQFNFDDRLRILMNGSGATCIHGVPMIEIDDDRLCFCTECEQTNKPNHKAWRRVKKFIPKSTLDQPKGTPKFQPKLSRKKHVKP